MAPVRPYTLWLVLPLLLTLLVGCSSRDSEIHRLEGAIFGTFYQISLNARLDDQRLDQLQQGVEAELELINASMSTYREESELSRLNQQPVGAWMAISAELMQVLQASQDISAASDGAFDVTVGSLVNLWSFGPEARPLKTPEDTELKQRMTEIGWQSLELDAEGQRARRTRNNYVDLSAIAKGHAVDRVSAFLKSQGLNDHLVNIGGDLIASGWRDNQQQPWRIGVELPDSSQSQVARHILSISNLSVATSGDYRNYFEADGQRYSHTIDPRNGLPVQHNLASTTVLHPSNMLADGWATALLVVGPDIAKQLAEQHGLMVLLLARTAEQGWESWASPALLAEYGEEQLKPLE